MLMGAAYQGWRFLLLFSKRSAAVLLRNQPGTTEPLNAVLPGPRLPLGMAPSMNLAYHPAMTEEAPLPVPREWLEALERADADVAAGRVRSGGAVRERLRDSIRRMQSEVETQDH